MHFSERTRLHLALGAAALAAAGCSDDPLRPDPARYSVSAPVRIYQLGGAQDLQIPQGLGLDINDAGTVVGGRPNGTGGTAAFAWTSAGGVQDLGTLAGGTWTTAFAVDANGQVVGGSIPSGASVPVAYLRSAAGAFRAVGTGAFSVANAVNDAGVVGGHADANGRIRAFLWSAASGPVLLRDRGGNFNSVRAVNNQGDAVGMFNTPEESVQRAAFWNAAGDLRELPRLPGGVYASAQGINNGGLVVGLAITGAHEDRAVLWHPDGRIQELGTLGGKGSAATGVNDLGEVVGYSQTSAADELRAFFWTAESGMMELPGLPGAKYTSAERINEKGQIVGYSGGSVVLWQITRPTR